MAYLTTLPRVQIMYHPAIGSWIGTDVETSSRVLTDVPYRQLPSRHSPQTRNNFNQDNRRPIRNSNQAPPGYKTFGTSGFRRGVVEPLALLGCLLTTFRNMSVPPPRIDYVSNQLSAYTAQHPTKAKASDKLHLSRQPPQSFWGKRSNNNRAITNTHTWNQTDCKSRCLVLISETAK
jgi:hypothetical protein